jgi:hypothetical protein
MWFFQAKKSQLHNDHESAVFRDSGYRDWVRIASTGKREALAKPLGSQSGTGILPVIHGRAAHATRVFARASRGTILLR